MGIEGFCRYERAQMSVKELGWVVRNIWDGYTVEGLGCVRRA